MDTARQGQHPAGRRPAGQAAQPMRSILQELGREPDQGVVGHARRWSILLKNEVAVVLSTSACRISTAFELAAMIREHPRFQQTAIIFISAVQLTESIACAATRWARVDYVPVPVVPEVLRAKVQGVRRALSQDPPARKAQRASSSGASPSAPPNSKPRLRGCCESEQRRSLALAAGQMGSWDWDIGQRRMRLGRRPVPDLRRREPDSFALTYTNIRRCSLGSVSYCSLRIPLAQSGCDRP